MMNSLPPDFTVFDCWIWSGLTLATVLFFIFRNCFQVNSYRIVQIDKLQQDCCIDTTYYIQYYNKFLCFKWWLYCYDLYEIGRVSYLNKTKADTHIRYLLSEKKSSKEIHPPTI